MVAILLGDDERWRDVRIYEIYTNGDANAMSLGLFTKARAAPAPKQTLAELNAARDLLDKRIAMLDNQAKVAANKALAYHAKINMRGAAHDWRRKKMFEEQIVQFSAQHVALTQTIGTIEMAVLQTETIGAMRQASSTMGGLVRACGDADTVMDDLGEQVAETNTVADSLGAPLGEDIDVDAELDELERELSPSSAPAAAAAAAALPEPDYLALIAAASAPVTPVRVAEYAVQ